MEVDTMLRTDKVLSHDDLQFLMTQVWPNAIPAPIQISRSRPCANPLCGRDIAYRPMNAQYCEDCGEARKRAACATYWRRKRNPVQRTCLDCPADISDRHGRAIRCIDCSLVAYRHKSRECARRYEAKRRAA